MLSYANIPGSCGSHTQKYTRTNKHADVPGAAVRTQTHDSWLCLRGPRPESGPADRRQTRLCLKYIGTAVSKHTHKQI